MTDFDHIRELRLLADLDEIAAQYEASFGASPINLSIWNPAPSVSRHLQLHLPPSPDLRGIDYSFSYELPERISLLRELGFDPSQRGGLITHSGSSGIVAAVNWLRAKGCRRVLIVGPRYFTVPYALNSMSIQSHVVHLHRSTSGFSIPNIAFGPELSCDAVWITNPVYCTSVDYDPTQLSDFFESALERRWFIVIDECLAEPGRRVAPIIPSDREPPRVCRRLQLLRRWSHEQSDKQQVFTRGPLPCGTAGPRS